MRVRPQGLDMGLHRIGRIADDQVAASGQGGLEGADHGQGEPVAVGVRVADVPEDPHQHHRDGRREIQLLPGSGDDRPGIVEVAVNVVS